MKNWFLVKSNIFTVCYLYEETICDIYIGSEDLKIIQKPTAD